MKPSEIVTVLPGLLRANLVPIIWGPPGVGKTDLVGQVAKVLGWLLEIDHPSVADPTDAKGLPMPDADGIGATFRPYGLLRRLLSATSDTLVFLDDLGQATAAVQASYMQLILGRRIGDHRLPDCVHFMAASNRTEDRAGVGRAITPLLNRAIHLDLDVDAQEWQRWAERSNISPEVRAYLSWKPSELLGFDPKTAQAQRAFATPRSWAMLSRAISTLPQGTEGSLLHPIAIDTVGEGSGTGFSGFVKIMRALPDPTRPLRDPSAPVPEDPAALFALACSLIEQSKSATPKQLENLVGFARRMSEEASVFLVLGVKSSHPKCLDNESGRAWVKEHRSLVLDALTAGV